jgi:hypothetical protein
MSGRATVALAGLRIGATLAAAAAAERAGRGDVSRLVLWWPCQSGRHFLREARARDALGGALDADLALPSPPPTGLADGAVELTGFALGPRLARELAALRLAALAARPAERVLVVERPEDAPADVVAAHLRALGAATDTRPLPGCAELFMAAVSATVPGDALGGVASWLADGGPGGRASSPPAHASSTARPTALVRDGAAGAPDVRERVAIFGDGHVGVLAEGASRGRTAVLLLHTGCDHRVGPNRLWVRWSRAWAARGIGALRFDPRGLGDTPPAPRGEGENAPYADLRVDDVRAACAYLREECGYERVVLVGLCSGGYYALRAAAAGVPACDVVAVNPQLYWGHEPYEPGSIDTLYLLRDVTSGANHTRRWQRWRRQRLGVRAIARKIGRALGAIARVHAHSARAAALGWLLRVCPARAGAYRGPLGDLWRLRAAGVGLSLVFGAEDDGLLYLEFQLRDRWRAFLRAQRCALTVVAGSDHTFTRAWMQRRLYDAITSYLAPRAG